MACVSTELDTAYSFDIADKIWLSIPAAKISFGSDAVRSASKEAAANFSRIIRVVEDAADESPVDTVNPDVSV